MSPVSASRARYSTAVGGVLTARGLTAEQAATALVAAMPEVRYQVALDAIAGMAIGIRYSVGDDRMIVAPDRDADPERDRTEAEAAQWRREQGTASAADWAAAAHPEPAVRSAMIRCTVCNEHGTVPGSGVNEGGRALCPVCLGSTLVPAAAPEPVDGLTAEQREYLAARLRAADPRPGAQRAAEGFHADGRADTAPASARGPLSAHQSTEGTQYVPAAVCSDCLVWAANADDSGAGPDWSPRVYANGLDLLGAASLVADGEEQGFQWAECPVCRVGGGGDRYAATLVFEPVTGAPWMVAMRKQGGDR